MRGGWLPRGLAPAAVTWCVAVGVWLWITPNRKEGTSVYACADSNGVLQQTTDRFTGGSLLFAELSGLGPVPLIIPVLLTALGAWAVWRGGMLPAAIATGVLLVFTVLAGFSIGAVYVPAVAALIWAVIALSDV